MRKDKVAVHLKKGDSFQINAEDVKRIIPTENLAIEIGYPGGFISKYFTANQTDESDLTPSSIVKRMMLINFRICANFPGGFTREAFFDAATKIAMEGTPNIEVLEHMLPTDDLLTEPMRRLVALQCIELEYAKQLYAAGDEGGAESHLLIAEEFSTEFMTLADALPGILELRSSKAGKARSAKRNPLRQECARLLRSHKERPSEGWKSHAEAARTIASDLSDFAEDNHDSARGLGEKDSRGNLDLVETIRRWIGRDPLIKQAYSGNSD